MLRAIAAAITLSAGLALPHSALAQTASAPLAAAADPDALCFLALGEAIVILSEHPEIITDQNRKYGNQIQQGVGFYSARVLARYPGDQLNDAVYAVSKAYLAMSKDQKKQAMMACMDTVAVEMRKFPPALTAASDRLKRESN